MLTNKPRRFFRHSRPPLCHSSESWNPVVMVAVAVLLIIGTVSFATPAFAIQCFNGDTGIWFESGTDECPSGATLDPGIVNWTNTDSLVRMGSENGNSGGGNITNLIFRINAILNTIVPFLVGIAVFIVMWGIFGYISHSAEEEKRQEARQFILWGVIFIFCMLSIWGFVNIMDNSFNLKKDPITVPSVFPPSP